MELEKMKSRLDKGGFPLSGINLALCENPLPPIDEAIEAAKGEAHLSNHYTEPYSAKLKERISGYTDAPVKNIHINAGSELILRQLFSLFGQRVHLISPTYYLFEEIGGEKTHTLLTEEEDFQMNIKRLEIPDSTTLAVIVNPNNPNGALFDIMNNTSIIERHPDTFFLIDEAFIEFGGITAAPLITKYNNVMVTRTFSKAFSLAGCRVGYVIGNREIVDYLDTHNDAYPLARTAEAAAIASLEHIDKIKDRVAYLKDLTKGFAQSLHELGIRTFPTETYFFLARVPRISANDFSEALNKKNIHVRPLHQEGLGDDLVRFATSASENNRIVIDAVREVMGDCQVEPR